MRIHPTTLIIGICATALHGPAMASAAQPSTGQAAMLCEAV